MVAKIYKLDMSEQEVRGIFNGQDCGVLALTTEVPETRGRIGFMVPLGMEEGNAYLTMSSTTEPYKGAVIRELSGAVGRNISVISEETVQ